MCGGGRDDAAGLEEHISYRSAQLAECVRARF